MDVHAFLQGWLCGAERLAVLGAGSMLKADDAAGVVIVERLKAEFPAAQYPELLFCPGETAPENFSGKILQFRPSHVLVLDAADVGLAPGSIVPIRPEDVGGPSYCSHMLPLRVMIDYLKAETGADVVLLGIQHESIAFDGEMTESVCGAVDALCDAMGRVVRECWGAR